MMRDFAGKFDGVSDAGCSKRPRCKASRLDKAGKLRPVDEGKPPRQFEKIVSTVCVRRKECRGSATQQMGLLGRPAGFTLLEVMVSVAILAVSLAVLLGFQGNTLIASARQERLTIATMLAREKMVEIEIDLDNAMQKGEFPDERSEEAVFDEPFEDYRWKMTLNKVELPAPVQAQEGSMQDVVAQQLTQEIGKTVRELRFEISWEEMGEQQTIEVVTHIIKL